MTYFPTHDFSGRPLATLSTTELRRRLAILRENDDGHFMTRQYVAAYERLLAAR